MTHAYLYIPTNLDVGDTDSFSNGVQAIRQFKGVDISDTAQSDVASIAVAPNHKVGEKRISRSTDGSVWLVDLGTWLPLPATSGRDTTWLIDQYATHGVHDMARKIQGFFALLIVDLRSRCVHVVTDRCGSLHMFYRQLSDGYAVCSSSAALALCGKSELDPVAVHEFLATGIIYEDRSLWADVKKIAPASVLTIDRHGAHSTQYWNFSMVRAESLDLNEAAEKIYTGLVDTLNALPTGSQPLVSDLTGGYDSRLLLAGLLNADQPFKTTVSGSVNQPDVVVAGQIASQFQFQHQHVVSHSVPSTEEFNSALSMTDGEYDAYDYSRILHTHRLLSANHSMSLNGSFGELARGYWWELLWPQLAKHQPLDAELVATRRFAAASYNKSIFEQKTQFDLREHMTEVVGRSVKHISSFPNTSQMDCVYFTMRMQRWQGRIASATNQLWPAFSPTGFAQVLDPILEAKASTRFRSLLVRKVFAQFSPTLARIPLEHGYPAMPATPLNLWRFTPLIGHYGDKVLSKVTAKLSSRLPKQSAEQSPLTQAKRPENTTLFKNSDMLDWMTAPLLLDTGLFRPEPLLALLDPNSLSSGINHDQWRRLITLEALLRRITQLTQ